MQYPHPPDDRRLAPILGEDGAINREAVARLFERDPETYTIAEAEAMQVVFFDMQDHPTLAGLRVSNAWPEKFVAVTGGTVTTERVEHQAGERPVRTHSVRRYRGRSDVRRYRAQMITRSTRVDRGRNREHRPGRTRRASSSSSTSGSDPGDGDPDPAPIDHPDFGRVNANMLAVLDAVSA